MTVRYEAVGVRPQANFLSQSISELIGRSPRSGKSIAAASGGALLSAALFVTPATSVNAQDAEDAAATETVLVTGSRIPRRDFTANAPIMTVDEQLFDDTSLIGVETVLNQMPQFVPAVTQFTTNDVAQTATNTVGVSTVSLRGLGPNRNLVLVNGQRAMPVDPTMIVDTNSIPSSAIARVEVISGGASAVYGADAVGGVVNFVLKDNFEGASVDLRVADTEHGGSQEITFSGLIGANTADGRGNVMIGVERATRTKQRQWERDWRLDDFANPNVNGELFVWGGSTWINSEFSNFGPVQTANPAYDPMLPTDPITNPEMIPNSVAQSSLDGPTGVFSDLPLGTINPGGLQLRVNDDGTVYTGQGFFQQNPGAVEGVYRYNGPIYGDSSTPNGGSGDLNGDFSGLPVFVEQPNGFIKENNLYSWSSSPLERLSSFGSGHFDLNDRVRVTAQASLSRTKTESSLGQTAANLNQWGAGVPFGDEIYRGNFAGDFIGEAIDTSIYDIPDSLIDVNENGIADAGDMTNPAYTIDGRFGVECDAAPTAEMPWLDGLPGCTNSEAWPTSADIYNIYSSRPDPDAIIWINRPPDYLRSALGAGRSTTNTTTTMNFSLGLEGELASGNDFWDVTVSTGRSDNAVQQRGSVALTQYRYLMLFPNFGRDAIFDPNPTDDGFAESRPTCTTGLPIIERFRPSLDCVRMISPSLKSEREMTQSILEANLVGDLAEIPAGPLQYAIGATYRENSFNYEPDFTSDNNSIFQIAGSYPNEASNGEFDVSEIYGELLIPIVSGGPFGAEHFTVELGGRISDWSMEQMPNLETYKALIDWGISDKYRIRGGFNRAFRAPNLGELFISRSQGFTGFGTKDWCSQNLDDPSLGGTATFSATSTNHIPAVPDDPATPLVDESVPAVLGAPTAQSTQSLNICQALMGPTGTFEYYTDRPLDDQATVGGTGVSNSFGNPNLREEKADTFTIGVVMDFHENMTLTVDWYEIEIEDMIALIGADATYQTCLDIEFNPTGDSTIPACQNITRNSATGSGSFVDRQFSNLGRALMSGADIQLNWSRPLGAGNFSFNSVANYNLKSETQDRSDLPTQDHVGYSSCSLQIQCQQYVYRIFSTMNYFQGPWNISLRHQYWPELEPTSCAAAPASIACVNNTTPTYQLFALTGGYTFADRYRVNVGIENLLDEDPPCTGANPAATPWPTVCNHNSGGSTYDPLGRRFFLSMTMDF